MTAADQGESGALYNPPILCPMAPLALTQDSDSIPKLHNARFTSLPFASALLPLSHLNRRFHFSCQVLMAVLEKALSVQWTESMANAWSELWQVRGGLYKVWHFGYREAERTVLPFSGPTPTESVANVWSDLWRVEGQGCTGVGDRELGRQGTVRQTVRGEE